MTSRETAPIESSILVLRGQRVILAADLARIYAVETRALNQAVKRNREGFPENFTFRLPPEEAAAIARSRSQSVILKRGENIGFNLGDYRGPQRAEIVVKGESGHVVQERGYNHE
ncbi:MAG: ORF6N domain-containing protein [Deltaproteobacteria bacterium]|nr:ORF6N domain-containing protein [Deltaproteobacteria bacterium]